MDRPVVDALTAMTIAAEEADIVDMVEAATMTAIVVLHDMTTVSDARMAAAMIMLPEASIVMLPGAATTVIQAAVTTTVVEASLMVGMGDAPEDMAMHQETLAIPTAEVETKTSALTIGTPVVDCGPLIHSGAERSAK